MPDSNEWVSRQNWKHFGPQYFVKRRVAKHFRYVHRDLVYKTPDIIFIRYDLFLELIKRAKMIKNEKTVHPSFYRCSGIIGEVVAAYINQFVKQKIHLLITDH